VAPAFVEVGWAPLRSVGATGAAGHLPLLPAGLLGKRGAGRAVPLDRTAILRPNCRLREFEPRPTLARLRRGRHPVGAECIKRQTARRRTLHKLRRERRDATAELVHALMENGS
jgi:hypothetical protein